MHQSELHLAKSLPAEFRGEVYRIESSSLDFFAQGFNQLHELVEFETQYLEGEDFFDNEVPHPSELLFKFRFSFKIPSHVGSLCL